MDCPINLEQCETYCNEKQVMPAMRYFVEDKGMPVNAAATEVEKLTYGMVTQGRARQVYNNRTTLHKRATKTDMTTWAIKQIYKEFVEDGTLTKEQAIKCLSEPKIWALWGVLFLKQNQDTVLDWYLFAFNELGKSARITDMFRTGHYWCDCPNCNGKAWEGKPLAKAFDGLFTSNGYLDYKAVSLVAEYRKQSREKQN